MGCRGKKGKGKGRLFIALGLLLCGLTAQAEEIQSPVQEIEVTNSYLTKAHIKTNSKTQIQTVKIEKSFLVWVTVQKAKDTAAIPNTTK